MNKNKPYEGPKTGLIVLSILIPLAGIIIYAVKQEKLYLYIGLAQMLLGFLSFFSSFFTGLATGIGESIDAYSAEPVLSSLNISQLIGGVLS